MGTFPLIPTKEIRCIRPKCTKAQVLVVQKGDGQRRKIKGGRTRVRDKEERWRNRCKPSSIKEIVSSLLALQLNMTIGRSCCSMPEAPPMLSTYIIDKLTSIFWKQVKKIKKAKARVTRTELVWLVVWLFFLKINLPNFWWSKLFRTRH